MDKSLVVFQDKKIRRTWFNDEWFFSIVDIIAVLTESLNPTAEEIKITFKKIPYH